jgi:hypothetical protein
MSWYRTPLWDLRPDTASCWNVAIWNLRPCFCGVPSLTRGRVCSLQCTHSMVHLSRTRNHILLSHLRFLQPGGPGSHIYIPQEQGGPVIPPGTEVPVRHLLWLLQSLPRSRLTVSQSVLLPAKLIIIIVHICWKSVVFVISFFYVRIHTETEIITVQCMFIDYSFNCYRGFPFWLLVQFFA